MTWRLVVPRDMTAAQLAARLWTGGMATRRSAVAGYVAAEFANGCEEEG